MIKELIYDKDLEYKVLNSLFHDTPTADYILKRIESNDFYFNNNKSLFQIIKEMREKNYAVAPDTVYTYCHTKESSSKANMAKQLMLEFLMVETGIPYITLGTDLKLLREISFQRKVQLLENPTIDDLNKIAEMKKIEFQQDIINPNDLLEQLFTNNDEEEIYSTGIKRMDGNFRFIRGQVNILSGIPSHGKSEFIDQIIINTIKTYKFNWLLFSPENYPVKNHLEKKLIPKFTDKKLEDLGFDEIDHAATEILKHIRFVNPITDNRKYENILDLLTEDVDALAIDPWNELNHDFEHEDINETRYIEKALTKIRNVARAREIVVFIAVHPRKMEKIPISKNKKFTYYPPPKPYDIMGSSNWYNKADSILSIYKPAEIIDDQIVVNKNAEVHIFKVRNKELGSFGVVPLKYNFDTGVIT